MQKLSNGDFVAGTIDYDFDEVISGFNNLDEFKKNIKLGLYFKYEFCCVLQYSSESAGHVPIAWVRGNTKKKYVPCSNCYILN